MRGDQSRRGFLGGHRHPFGSEPLFQPVDVVLQMVSGDIYLRVLREDSQVIGVGGDADAWRGGRREVMQEEVEKGRRKDCPLRNPVRDHPGFGFCPIIGNVSLPARDEVGQPLPVIRMHVLTQDLRDQDVPRDGVESFGDVNSRD